MAEEHWSDELGGRAHLAVEAFEKMTNPPPRPAVGTVHSWEVAREDMITYGGHWARDTAPPNYRHRIRGGVLYQFDNLMGYWHRTHHKIGAVEINLADWTRLPDA